ncbi:MAG: FecR domain-containing protein [Bradyrhizobium sp.]|nr:FecR domain-containing protein [Bradyrhizobium sp.]MDO8400965.1 FecR domain-containing protein [Bradyrhizobium sp.]
MPALAADGVNEQVRLAQAAQPQAQPAPAAPTAAAPGASADAQAPEEPIGNVATVVGNATVTRNDAAIPLKVKDEIYLNDVVQTSAKSSLGITFNDATTFNLTANAKITIDTFVYEDGGKNNAALFEVVKGTVAFVAASVAKTGDMKISTPTATLGIRGTSGVVEVPEDASATSRNNVAVKLYPDADGKVGRIEVNDRAGLRLGFLSQGASGFTIRAGAGARFAAVPLTISPQQILRDQGFVRQVHSTQNLGRRVVNEHRAFRRANPGLLNPNRPNRSGQPGGLRPNGPQRQNNLQNRPGQQQQPGLPNRQGLNRQGLNRQGLNPQGLNPQGLPQRAGSPAQPRVTGQPALPPRPGQLQPPGGPTRAGAPAPAQPNAPGLAPRPNLQQPNLQPQQGAPGLLRPGLQNRPALQRRPAAPARRLPREIR